MYLQISVREYTVKVSSLILNLNYSQQPPRTFCADLDKFQLSTSKVVDDVIFTGSKCTFLFFTCLTMNSDFRKSD